MCTSFLCGWLCLSKNTALYFVSYEACSMGLVWKSNDYKPKLECSCDAWMLRCRSQTSLQANS